MNHLIFFTFRSLATKPNTRLRFLLTLALVGPMTVVKPLVAGDNVWTNGSGNSTWNTSSANWTSPTVWTNANVDSAIFNASGAGTITMNTGVTVRAMRFDVAGYTLSGGATITLTNGGSGSLGVGEIQANADVTIDTSLGGTTGLVKTGSGTLILTRTNPYTGGTTISAGTLQVGNGGTTGVINGDIANNGTLIVNRGTGGSFNYTGVISGSGNFIKRGDGLMSIVGTQTYLGTTTIEAGTLQLGNGIGGQGSLPGNVLNHGTLSYNLGSFSTTYNGVISGSGSVTKSGTGRVTFMADQQYTGTTTIGTGGSIALGANSAAGSIAGNIINNGFLLINRSNTLTYGGVISGNGELNVNNGTYVLTNVNTYAGLSRVGPGTLTLSGTGSIANSSAIVIAGLGGLDVTGLTGGLNHDGTRFALATGQALRGRGNGVTGGVNARLNSSIQPGLSGVSSAGPGSLTLTGSVDMAPGSTLGIILNGTTDTDTHRSRLVPAGSFSFAGTAANPFVISITNGGSFSGSGTTSFTIVSAGSVASTGLDTPLTATVGAGGTGSVINTDHVQISVSGFSVGDHFTVQRSGSSILLTYAPVPEPGFLIAAGVLGIGGGLILRRQVRCEFMARRN